MQEKLLHAERTGQLIDMTKDVDEHQVRSINMHLERQDADEKLAAVKRGLDAELVPLREQKVAPLHVLHCPDAGCLCLCPWNFKG